MFQKQGQQHRYLRPKPEPSLTLAIRMKFWQKWFPENRNKKYFDLTFFEMILCGDGSGKLPSQTTNYEIDGVLLM
jgi:hypothetical protein